MSRQSIRFAIDDARARIGEQLEVTPNMVIGELFKIAFSDPGAMFNEAGDLLSIHEMPDDARASIAAIDVESIMINGFKVGEIKKIKRWDRLKALEHLGRTLAMFKDKVDVNLNVDFAKLIEAGKTRLAERDTTPRYLAAPVIEQAPEFTQDDDA